MRENSIDLTEAESDFLAAATYLAENIKSRVEHAEAVKEIVGRYLAKNDVDTAARLADSVDDNYTRDRLLGRVAEKCASLGDDEYALQLADAIEDFTLQASARERIARRKAERGEFEKASEIAGTLPHSFDLRADISLQRALAADDENKALEAVSQFELHHSRVGALTEIAAHLDNRGKREKALETLLTAAAEARKIEAEDGKVAALLSIADLYRKVERFDKSIETLAEAKTGAENLAADERETVLTRISIDFLRAGSLDLADRTLDSVTNKTQMARALAGFAEQFDAQGERLEALDALEESYAILKSRKNTGIGDSAAIDVFGQIVVLFAAFDKPERAIEIALENPVAAKLGGAFERIARICVTNENDAAARRALNFIDEDSARVSALIACADLKDESEKKDEALRLLNEAEKLCANESPSAISLSVLRELAIRLNNRGETGKMRAALLAHLRSIHVILDKSSRAAALAELAEVYDSLGYRLNETERDVLRTILRKT